VKRTLIDEALGPDPLNRALRNAALDAHNAHLLLEFAHEAPEGVELRAGKQLSRLGDEATMRDVPIIGRGSGGAIRGTRPGDSLRWL